MNGLAEFFNFTLEFLRLGSYLLRDEFAGDLGVGGWFLVNFHGGGFGGILGEIFLDLSRKESVAIKVLVGLKLVFPTQLEDGLVEMLEARENSVENSTVSGGDGPRFIVRSGAVDDPFEVKL